MSSERDFSIPADIAVDSPARTIVTAMNEAFRSGDYVRMAALYHDDIDWLFHGPVSIFREVGHRRGKAAVFQAFEIMAGQYRYDRHDTQVLIAEGDTAATIADVAMMQRATGRTIHTRIASFHRVRDGKLIEYRGFADTFDVVEQTLGRELDV
jgi:ketosteroid isomerase-like protein